MIREIPELTSDEIQKFNLKGFTGKKHFVFKPVWEGYDVVWEMAILPTTPYYQLYNTGTNSLIILRYLLLIYNLDNRFLIPEHDWLKLYPF